MIKFRLLKLISQMLLQLYLFNETNTKSRIVTHPANTRRWPNVRLVLCQHRRRWTNIGPTLRVFWECMQVKHADSNMHRAWERPTVKYVVLFF